MVWEIFFEDILLSTTNITSRKDKSENVSQQHFSKLSRAPYTNDITIASAYCCWHNGGKDHGMSSEKSDRTIVNFSRRNCEHLMQKKVNFEN